MMQKGQVVKNSRLAQGLTDCGVACSEGFVMRILTRTLPSIRQRLVVSLLGDYGGHACLAGVEQAQCDIRRDEK